MLSVLFVSERLGVTMWNAACSQGQQRQMVGV
jgi:hypothetical protein